MNVIIAGERYSSNLGDPIISEAVEYILKKNINDVKISYLDLSGRKNYEIEKETNLITKAKKSSLKMKISKMLTKYHIDLEYLRFKRAFLEIEKTLFKDLNFDHIDLIIFPGGQLFKDTFIFQTEKIVKFAQENKIPVVFNSIGYGEIRSKKMRLILKRTLLLDNVTHISTRDDQDSINKLLDYKKEVKVTYDAGILASDVYSIKKSKSEILGLGVMYVHTIDYNEQIKFWTNLINKLSENNIKWNIFTNGPKKDEEFAEHILELIGYDNKTINSLLIRNITSPNQLVKIISNFNSLISLRLHSHIVAYSLGIPTISIVWDNKVKLFFETIKYPSRCFDITSDTNQILNMLDSIIKEEYDQKIKTEQIKELEDILIMETVKQLRRR